MENPVLESEDKDSGAINCTGSLSLDLPPGVAVAGGRRTLTANIDYTLQPAADGSGDVILLRNADAIVAPLATLARIAPAPQQPVTTNEIAPSTRCRHCPPAGVRSRTSAADPPDRREAELQLRQCPHPRRDRGLPRRRPRHARPQMAAQYQSLDRRASPDQRRMLRQTRDRFLGYRDRCPTRRLHRRRLSRPDARDPRHHRRGAGSRRDNWG